MAEYSLPLVQASSYSGQNLSSLERVAVSKSERRPPQYLSYRDE